MLSEQLDNGTSIIYIDRCVAQLTKCTKLMGFL